MFAEFVPSTFATRILVTRITLFEVAGLSSKLVALVVLRLVTSVFPSIEEIFTIFGAAIFLSYPKIKLKAMALPVVALSENEMVPDPFVTMASFALPSDVGSVNAATNACKLAS